MRRLIYLLLLCLPAVTISRAQNPTLLSGYTTDIDDAAVPGASVTVDGPSQLEHYTTASDDTGFFEVIGLKPGIPYKVMVVAEGFAASSLAAITLSPGQHWDVTGIKLIPSTVTTVAAISPEEAAVEEVHAEESQRVLGIVPNFYVVYGNAPFVPLSTKLKYHLALKSSLDPVSFIGAAFFAGINQAGATPSFVEGAKGFGQRFGAAYTDATTDIMFGGAILPSLFHQDPRYFVQGTGTKKARVLHALSSPFICKGDDGHLQFNISSIGGDLISGAGSNIYYPPYDRGPLLTFSSALISTGGRMLNSVLQEFVFGRFTTRGK
jgi:hypothetical protein